MKKIEIDDDIYRLLKQHADPFEDTPNTVLRRLLLSNDSIILSDTAKNKQTESLRNRNVGLIVPNLPNHTSRTLDQILSVIYLIRVKGMSRVEAKNFVAKIYGVTPETIHDKYTRTLGVSNYEISSLLDAKNTNTLKTLLLDVFPKEKQTITNFFRDNGLILNHQTKPIETTDNINSSDTLIGKRIKNIRFNDKIFFPKDFSEMMVVVCKELLRLYPDNFSCCLNLVGRSMKYFSKNASELAAPKRIGNSEYFVETKLHNDSKVVRLKELMKLLGHDTNDPIVETF